MQYLWSMYGKILKNLQKHTLCKKDHWIYVKIKNFFDYERDHTDHRDEEDTVITKHNIYFYIQYNVILYI